MTRADIIALLMQAVAERNERDDRIRQFQDFVFHTTKPPGDFSEGDWRSLAILPMIWPSTFPTPTCGEKTHPTMARNDSFVKSVKS